MASSVRDSRTALVNGLDSYVHRSKGVTGVPAAAAAAARDGRAFRPSRQGRGFDMGHRFRGCKV
jgi:hypothetical protein